MTYLRRIFAPIFALLLAALVARDLYPESPPEGKALAAALRLEQLRFTFAAGAGANTNIAVAGITTDDRIVTILNLTDADSPAAPTIQEDGQVRSTDVTTGDDLLVVWVDCTA